MIDEAGATPTCEVETLEEFRAQGRSLRGCAVQGLDLSGQGIRWDEMDVEGAYFLGCRFDSTADVSAIITRGAFVLPEFPPLAFEPFRGSLYTPDGLLEGFDADGYEQSVDQRIYRWFHERQREPSLVDALAQRVHDAAIDDALRDYLADEGDAGRRVVGFMGGHALRRTEPAYALVARLGRLIARDGLLVVTGGGPGAMEAANLGAYFAADDEAALERALEILRASPHYDPDVNVYVRAGLDARALSGGAPSLSVPTWGYGHEPTNVFATAVAKYFSNSLREDGLLAIALRGVVFAAGSAGTLQEVFQDAAQNHYRTFDYASPMLFFGSTWYTDAVFELLMQLGQRARPDRDWRQLVAIRETPEDALAFLKARPPVADVEEVAAALAERRR